MIRLPFRTDLTNDGTYHGGVIASSGHRRAAAAWSNHDFDSAATVAMSIQYTGAAKRCDLPVMRALPDASTRGTHLPRSPQPIPTGTSSSRC